MIYHGDLFDVLPTLDAESFDACVTDPPYGLGFMAKEWDVPGGIGAFPMRRRVETDAVNTGASRQGGRQRSCDDFQKRQKRDAQAFESEAERWAIEVFRVLKPGAHLVAFGGTRMFHRMASGIEDAGFEIRDCLSWLYGQGFPKSLNLGDGRGTALKPSWEPIILARKPTVGTVKANVERYGTAALNIEACRIEASSEDIAIQRARTGGVMGARNGGIYEGGISRSPAGHDDGRWPANVLLDEEAAAMLDEMTGDVGGGDPREFRGGRRSGFGNVGAGVSHDSNPCGRLYNDTGGASRFYLTVSTDCILCCLPTDNRSKMSACEITSASTAERRSRITRQIIDGSALLSAGTQLAEQIAHRAPSVENLCERCVIRIALALVETRLSGSKSAVSAVFQGSIPSSKSSILTRSLVSFAALWASIDTIPTTDSLSLLFGSVVHAIGNCTRRASHESASDQTRFLYSAKPSREERDFGCEGLTARQRDESRKEGNPGGDNPRNRGLQPRGNFHPTVKPVELMRWLVKLVTPPDGLVLDPFTGSGTTGMACRYEHRRFVGIEREADYIAIAERRIAAVAPLFGEASA